MRARLLCFGETEEEDGKDDEDETALEAPRATLRRRPQPVRSFEAAPRSHPLDDGMSYDPKEPGRSDPYTAAVAAFRDATVFAFPRHLPFSSAGWQLSIVDHSHDETADVYRAGGTNVLPYLSLTQSIGQIRVLQQRAVLHVDANCCSYPR
ncbi:shaggy-related protein kinase [Musa troglodytarum]|uniref:Shaggy-related protein kinase n=1 Tax=Musa troglodytarum TaxID=320322 RepID=A0A9E7L0T8_9LILI|nr:shaggy-related protein kinase [Musa troglodytarum]